MFKVIDTHTHLDAEEFDEDRAEAFARAREAGVGKVFLPAIDVKTTHAVLALSREYPGYAYPMIGLHPEEVKADWKEQLAELRKMQISDFIAIGEIGLDYYWSQFRSGTMDSRSRIGIGAKVSAANFHYDSV